MYVAILAVVSVGAVGLLLSLSNLFQLYRTQKILFDSSVTVMERIATEIRTADSVDVSSVFNVPNSSLTLDRSGSLVTFAISGDDLEVVSGGVLEGQLNRSEVTVDHFFVYHYTTSDTEMARIRIRLTATTENHTATNEYEFAANIRGSYVE